MGNPNREELQQEMIAQEKINSTTIGSKKQIETWIIWDNLNPQTRDWTATIAKEVEEELGKRKIVVLEEEDQLRWGKKNGGEFNLKEA